MGNGNSQEQIDKLKSKTFRSTFDRIVYSLQEYKLGSEKQWERVDFVLHDSILSCYISCNLENSIEVNKDLHIKLNKKKLLIAFPQDSHIIVWKIRSSNPSLLQEWVQALILSKRPRFIQDILCQNCKKAFNSFRRKHHCRSCGRILCDDCSKGKIILECMGYNSKKRICIDCKETIKNSKSLFTRKKKT